MFETVPEVAARYEAIPPGLDEMEPGPVLAAWLSGIDVRAVSGHDRVVVLRARQRMASHYQAQLQRDMMAIVDTYRSHDGHPGDLEHAADAAATEVRVALCLTRRAADAEVELAYLVHERAPVVWEALLGGRIDRRRARVLIDDTLHLPDGVARAVIDRIIDQAPGLTTGQLRVRLRKLCLEVDPDHAQQQLERAVADRRVVTQPHPDGSVELCAIGLPPHRAAAAMERINRIARSLRGPQETRTIDQLRADVLCDLLTGNPHQAARAGGVELTIDLPTLIGLDRRAGDLAGYGPVIADLARQITAERLDAPWRYTVRDPATGEFYVGVTRRRPDTLVARKVRARYRRCVFPGCRMPAVDCDLDHRTRVADGGATTERDLSPLCRHDHCARHNGWTYRRLPDGTHRWTSPLGHTYTTHDEPP